MKNCTDTTSNLGGEFSNRTYDMDSYEHEVNNYITKSSSNAKKRFNYVIDPPPGMFSRKSKLGPGMKTEYVDKRMLMGLFHDDGPLSFKRAKLSGIGLTVFLKQKPTSPLSCTDAESCKAAFFSNDNVVTSNTAQVFFGRFAKSPTRGSLKDGFGLCYVVDTKSGSDRGRLYMGSWYQGKMNGLGIEVDFELTGNPNNPYKAIGIFFGYFFLGNRDYFGVYFFAADGKLHYVFYPRGGGNSCVIESSYDGDVLKQKEFKQAAKISLSSAFKIKDGFVNLEHYEKFLKDKLDHLVSTGGLDKSTSASLTDMDRQVYKAYKPVYNNFVTFCFGLLSMVRNEYVAKRDEDKTAEEKEAASKQSMEDAIALAQKQGRLADIEDPRKKKEKDIEIANCVTLLTSKGVDYDVISPDEKKRLEEEKLATIKKEHEELMAEKKGFEQAAINAALLGQTKLNRSSQSSSGPIMPPLTLSFNHGRKSGSKSGSSTPPRFGTPGSGFGNDSPGSVRKNLNFSTLPRRGVLLEPIAESMVESGLDIVEGSRNSRVDGIHHDGEALGGGKRTRKNMRMRTRTRTRMRAGTRRSRYGGEVSVV
jgi:hypothetical protein